MGRICENVFLPVLGSQSEFARLVFLPCVENTLGCCVVAAVERETVGTTINQLMVSRSQLNSKWEKTLVDLTLNDKEFQQVSAQLTALNKRKTEIATELLALRTSLNRQRNQISNNLLTVNALSTQLGSSEDALDPMAVAFIDQVIADMGRAIKEVL